MHQCRSAIAEMLRERHRLLEELHKRGNSQPELLKRLQRVDEEIEAEENRGPRTYLDHINGPVCGQREIKRGFE